MNIGLKIKKYRKEKNFSQEKLAKVLNVSSQSISKYENGLAEPSLDSVVKMGKLFNISLDYLLADDTKLKDEWVNLANELSSGEYTLLQKSNMIEKFFNSHIELSRTDSIWQIGAKKLIKGAILYLTCHNTKVSVENIKRGLRANKIEDDKQQKLIAQFNEESEIIQENVFQSLDCATNTFKSYMQLATAILNNLE